MNTAKKVVAYIMIGGILIMTIIGVLGIWDVIDMELIIRRMIYSLLVIFASSGVILLVYSMLLKEDQKPKEL